MGLDLRIPIGLMFLVYGMLLSGFGLFSNRGIYRLSLGINVNLIWGLIMLGVGLIMLILILGRSAGKPAAKAVAGAPKPQEGGNDHA